MLVETGIDGAVLNDGRPEAFRLFPREMAWVAAGLVPAFAHTPISADAVNAIAERIANIGRVETGWLTSAFQIDGTSRPAFAFTGVSRWDRELRAQLLQELRDALAPVVPGIAVVPIPLEPDPDSRFIRVVPAAS